MLLSSYDNLSEKLGEIVAYQCLTEIEKAAHICSADTAGISPEIRFVNAIRAQDTMCEVVGAAAA